MKKSVLFAVLLTLSYISEGAASMPQPINKHIPQAELVGEGKMTFMFWDVYDAQLFAPEGDFQDSPPYALTLTYLRDFSGEDIAERSVKEMKKQGFDDTQALDEWLNTMSEIFPDVAKGEKLTGVFKQDGTTEFFKNDESIGTVENQAFGEQFFAIWLNEKTSDPSLRKKLLGVN